MSVDPNPTVDATVGQWRALWALVVGFFMILVDMSIVSVATPAIMADLGADVDAAVWVTSGYLLAFAVPLLITGRLGDRFGPRRVYLAGLAVFTLASLWCGLTGSIGWLIAARVVQGLGAAIMAPQTMAVITRTFPPDNRGKAMSVWGSVASVATLVGPVLGGVLTDGLGWEWIFFVNVPVGVVGIALVARLVPELPTHVHRFDLVGVALSAAGMLLLVFGIQEGQNLGWGTIVWSLIVAGLVVMALFVAWQARNRAEPLLSLALFRDRNFSLGNIGIATVGFAVTAMAFPMMFYAQGVLGLSPTGAALLLAPTSIVAGALSPYAGTLTDRTHPRILAGFGLATCAVSLLWFALIVAPDTPIWALLLPITLLGLAHAFMWGPIGVAATQNLPAADAGAGSGVYNTMRQIGAVLGGAGVAVLMQARMAADLPGGTAGGGGIESGIVRLPEQLHAGFAAAMGESLVLPAVVLVAGLTAALSFARPRHLARVTEPVEPAAR